jgi:hypothetical protein
VHSPWSAPRRLDDGAAVHRILLLARRLRRRQVSDAGCCRI